MRTRILCLVYYVFLSTVGSKRIPRPIRDTVYGKIRGSWRNQGRVEVYEGVPYAEPPIGPLRFKKPENPQSWPHYILDTFTIPYACPQSTWSYIVENRPSAKRISSEDCLYLNLYVPKISNSSQTFPVLLFVHGGSNVLGMGAMIDGTFLAESEQIIVVTFNYRLGLLGFYVDKNKGYDGNYGLLDQVKAMQWVQANIAFFNGDPSRVTLYGHSAGSGDVGLHLVSDLTKGLYKNAVLHSGSPLAFWAVSECEKNSRRKQPPDWCFSESYNARSIEFFEKFLVRPLHDGDNIFPPVIDNYFLKNSPEKLFKCSQCNAETVLLIMARDEGGPLYKKFSMTDEKDYKEFQGFIDNMKIVFPDEIIENLTDTYTYWKDNNISRFPYTHQMRSDILFFAPTLKLADLLSKWMKEIFLLSFEHISENQPGPPWQGVPHGWDLFYFFGVPVTGHPLFNYTEEDKNVSMKSMEFIGNYVKSGSPYFDGKLLEPFNVTLHNYNKLDSSHGHAVLTHEINFRRKEIDYWSKYLFAYDDLSCLNSCNVNGLNALFCILSLLFYICFVYN